MDQGHHFWSQKNKDFAQNLNIARQYFLQARMILLTSSSLDSALFVQVYYTLMNVEVDMSCNRDIRPEGKWSHLQTAEDYGNEAFAFAIKLLNTGHLAQVKLHQPFLLGRKAEVRAQWGADPREIREQKNIALGDITIALEELQRSDRSNIDENLKRAMTWRNRLTRS